MIFIKMFNFTSNQWAHNETTVLTSLAEACGADGNVNSITIWKTVRCNLLEL